MAYIDTLKVNDIDYDIGASVLTDGENELFYSDFSKLTSNAVLTVSSTQPSSMKTGDVWYKIV